MAERESGTRKAARCLDPLISRSHLPMLQRLNDLFGVWVIAASLLAFVAPGAFAWFQPYIVPGLGVIMLGMGITLVPADFRRVGERWPAVLLGIACQYGLMPLGGFFVSRLLGLPEALAVGVMLVTSCPGGTASNVIAYLAGADVALSVSMTTASTLLAPLMTPLMLQIYARASVQVGFLEQGWAIAQIVVLPVVAGVLARAALDRHGGRAAVAGALHVFPSISIAFIVMIVACIVAVNRERLGELGPAVVAAVMLTNALGLAGGYAITRLARFDRVTARTIAIEVGLQNSGLGVALASKFFAPATALPSAFYSLWHNVTGPVLASYWRRKD